MLFLKYLIIGCFFLSPAGCLAWDNAAPSGFLQGHLEIVSPKPVELVDGEVPKVTPETFAEYPLIVLSQDTKKEVALITADKNGNYRVALPPGTYILDVQDRARKHVRAKPKRFTVVSKQIAHVDMDIDTGIR
jgi:hypothetical protein